jgi:hypothetical protein
MTHKEYLQKISDLESEYQNKQIALAKQFVNANNPHKIGDKVTDHIGSIIIEKIKFGIVSYNLPIAVYEGKVLKKDGTPKLNCKVRSVYQSNLIN